MSRDLKIMFMGTPEFAVPSLEKISTNGYKPVAVVTAPDRPKGRGRKLQPSPVKAKAEELDIPVLQPVNLKSDDFREQLTTCDPNLIIIVAFRMLPESVWSYPEYGSFNLHASLLPDYRGAAPINWAVINGEKETGVTTFFLKHEIDTGNILFQEKEIIHDDDDAGSLYDRLMEKGAGLVLKTVEAIAAGTYEEKAQDKSGQMKTAPKIYRETCEIDWDQEIEDVRNFVRGLSPYPGAWTVMNDHKLKVFRVSPTLLNYAGEPSATVDTDQKTYLHVKCRDGWIAVDEIQPEGKKRMKIEEYFRGNQL